MFKDLKLQEYFLKLLDDNLNYMINYIYEHQENEPYHQTKVRATLAINMILASQKLIPTNLATLVLKDLSLLKEEVDSNQLKEIDQAIQLVRRQTEIDDLISLNLPGQSPAEDQPDLADFDLQSQATLNTSVYYGPQQTPQLARDSACSIS